MVILREFLLADFHISGAPARRLILEKELRHLKRKTRIMENNLRAESVERTMFRYDRSYANMSGSSSCRGKSHRETTVTQDCLIHVSE